MKTNKLTTGLLAVVLLVGMSLSASAQRGQRMNQDRPGMRAIGQGFNQDGPRADCVYLQLSEDQQAKIATLRLALTEKNLPVQNKLGEMRAKMQSLKTGDNQDLKAISNLIDDMSKVQSQIRKNAAEHQLAVRALLTNDQKVMFDARQGRQGNHGKGMRGNKAGMQRGLRAGCTGFNQ